MDSGLRVVRSRYAFVPYRITLSPAGPGSSEVVLIDATQYLRGRAGQDLERRQAGGRPTRVPAFVWDLFQPFRGPAQMDTRGHSNGRSDVRSTALIWALSVMLGMALLIPACRTRSPAAVSLATLAAAQESYLGRRVRTEGVVRRFIDPSGPYFVIEDANRNRVALIPAPRVAAYRGRRVEVIGTFEFNQTLGRFIDVEDVLVRGDRAPTEATSPAAPSRDGVAIGIERGP